MCIRDSTRTELKEKTEALQSLEHQLQTAHSRCEDIQAQVEELKGHCNTTETELQEKCEAVLSVNQQLQAAESRCEGLQTQVEADHDCISNLHAQVAQLGSQLEEVNLENNSLHSQLNKLVKENRDMGFSLNSDLASKSTQLAETETLVKQLKSSLEDALKQRESDSDVLEKMQGLSLIHISEPTRRS